MHMHAHMHTHTHTHPHPHPHPHVHVYAQVPPEAYFPFCDAWIEAHPDALLLIATDEASYYERAVSRYGLWSQPRLGSTRARRDPWSAVRRSGRIISASTGYHSRNVISDTSVDPYTKGLEVLLDALLLSRSDFLLKTSSAVAEFAIWVNLRLHHAHLDLQWEDRFHSQSLPPWASHVGRNDAQMYCAALARGCRIDLKQLVHASGGVNNGSAGGGSGAHMCACTCIRTRLSACAHVSMHARVHAGGGSGARAHKPGRRRRELDGRDRGDRGDGALGSAGSRGGTGYRGGGRRALLQPGQACARCQPRIESAAFTAARAAMPIPLGERCVDAGPMRRGLTQAECIAYARLHTLDFLGTQHERTEFAGCVVWNGKNAEFNSHEAHHVGCNIGAGGGACLCTQTH